MTDRAGAPDAAHENRRFYDEHYRSSHPALFLLRARISFDQQAKTRRNLALLLPALRELRRDNPGRELRVLDYGCGFGSFLLALPRQGVLAHGYDLSERAIAELQRAARLVGRRIRPPQIEPGGAFTEADFDVITCSHVLEHVGSDDALIAQFARALRADGVLLINVPINEVWDDPKHVRRYDAETLAALLRRHGFEPIANRQGDRWTGWLLRREVDPGCARSERLLLRALRAGLALLPLGWLEASERGPVAEVPAQQLLMLARKTRSR